jgi:putative membrane protein
MQNDIQQERWIEFFDDFSRRNLNRTIWLEIFSDLGAQPEAGKFMRDENLLLRWLIASIAIYIAVKLLPGIRFEGPWWQLGIVALLFGFFNAIVRPILVFLTCPLVLLTLGLLIPIINALMLGLTATTARFFGIRFEVDGFWAAFWGTIVISIVSWLLNLFIHSERGDQPT